ncbi:oxidoreductase [Verticillium alfalfae VaMs.102]|uniref:Oxidoreductase n=1 Tax=Verticillium alfalfae (strain VaMs.102 / ATCC MYA-4576 / FGSC 10136) TaxID=526221 RepID=C9SNV1_VERA1|nr:oxidoreductase [Verticillium alfalfae VaMs.102]EEY20466.1 oxidoreductase [Verticillium alfalfae VaMs.102]
MPKNLNYLEAGTLSCAALTAWNALYGVRPVGAGDWVLTQGTGGVSIAGLQFAKAAGARVIATTSSPAKAEMLKKLGADHVINYKKNPNWGDEAKAISGGVKHVIEVGGMNTMRRASTPSALVASSLSLAGLADRQMADWISILSKAAWLS